MLRRVAISLVLCATIGSWFAASAAAEDAAAPGGQAESSLLPPLTGPNGEPINVQGAVEGAVAGTVGTVAGTVEAATGGGAPPTAPPTSPDPGHGSEGGTVGKVVTGTTKAAGDAAAAVKGDVESVTGTATHTPHVGPETTGAPTETSPAAPSPEGAAPEPGAAEVSTGTPDAVSRSASSSTHSGSAAPHRSAGSSPHPQATGLAQNRRVVQAVAPAAAEGGLSASALQAVAADARGVFGASSGAASADSEATGGTAPAGDETGGGGHSLRLADFSPDHPLGILLFLLVLGAGALALTVVMRRELGMSFLPWRRFRG